ncbi:LPD7 domain-containing protein [Metapseudomonas otitidis]|uniref:LPD7 domain-containing protein n=1 Tax=Metapseudomonas otitidis TaxID=319939 RepID=UPI000D1B8C71|nr:LPD7 domain-containing protein [Pseudomonas otitidis]
MADVKNENLAPVDFKLHSTIVQRDKDFGSISDRPSLANDRAASDAFSLLSGADATPEGIELVKQNMRNKKYMDAFKSVSNDFIFFNREGAFYSQTRFDRVEELIATTQKEIWAELDAAREAKNAQKESQNFAGAKNEHVSFRLNDPRYEVDLVSDSELKVRETAERLQSGHYWAYDAGGNRETISQVDGKWPHAIIGTEADAAHWTATSDDAVDPEFARLAEEAQEELADAVAAHGVARESELSIANQVSALRDELRHGGDMDELEKAGIEFEINDLLNQADEAEAATARAKSLEQLAELRTHRFDFAATANDLVALEERIAELSDKIEAEAGQGDAQLDEGVMERTHEAFQAQDEAPTVIRPVEPALAAAAQDLDDPFAEPEAPAVAAADATVIQPAAAQDEAPTVVRPVEPALAAAAQDLDDPFAEPEAPAAATTAAQASLQKEAPASPKAANDADVNQVEGVEVKNEADLLIIPPKVAKQFIAVGNKYFSPIKTDQLVFEDKGNRLETRFDNGQIASSFVEIAEARGWSEIKVSGTEEFRREVWIAASLRGIDARGFKPTDADRAELQKREAGLTTNAVSNGKEQQQGKDAASKGNSSEQGKAAEPQVDRLSGELLAHGKAPYMHDKSNKASYYVTLRNADGQENTAWGVDLARALEDSGAQIGQQVQLTNEGQRKVDVEVEIKDKEGNVVRKEWQQKNRNQWNVDAAEAFRTKDPAEAVKEHPELAGAYAAVRAASLEARRAGLTPEQLKIVEQRVRDNAVNSIERGSYPQPKLHVVDKARERHDVEEQREVER